MSQPQLSLHRHTSSLLQLLQEGPHTENQTSINGALQYDGPGKQRLVRPWKLVLAENVAPAVWMSKRNDIVQDKRQYCETQDWFIAQRWLTEVLCVND